jgi:hypothetical protein
MRFFDLFRARLICWKYRLHWEEIKFTQWPKMIWIKSIKRYIVFCPYCGEYICDDGICSNPFCPERINDEN